MLHDALEITSGPVAIRYPRTAAVSVAESDVGSGLNARRVTEGRDVCIIAVGKMLASANEAAALLADDGITASVWDARCVKPLDPRMLDDAAAHPLVVTIEDGIRDGGIGFAIRDQLAERGADSDVRVLGVPDQYIAHGEADEILTELGLDAAGIVATVRSKR